MYKVIVDEHALVKLESFIGGYKRLFLKLFTDTGITDEELIRENFIKAGDALDIDILGRLETLLSATVVLGTKKGDDNVISISFRLRKYLVVVHYMEYLSIKERKIVDINIHKK